MNLDMGTIMSRFKQMPHLLTKCCQKSTSALDVKDFCQTFMALLAVASNSFNNTPKTKMHGCCTEVSACLASASRCAEESSFFPQCPLICQGSKTFFDVCLQILCILFKSFFELQRAPHSGFCLCSLLIIF